MSHLFLSSSSTSVYTLKLNVRLVQALLIAWQWRESCRYCPRSHSGPLSIISCSQSQCEDNVAHRHSIDFRMWCTVSSGWLPGAPDTLTGQNSLMPAFARSTGCRIQMDHPVAFPIRILSLPAPALEKWVLLSHSVTLICHFLLNNRIFVTTNTYDVTNKLRKDERRGNGGKIVKLCSITCLSVLFDMYYVHNCKWLKLTNLLLLALCSFRLNFQGGADFCLHCIYDASGIRWKTCHYTIYLMLQPTVCKHSLHLDTFRSSDS